jgi:hypothetical protein
MTYYRVIFLTTPHSSNSNNAWNVNSTGNVNYNNNVYNTNNGVRPALYLDPTLSFNDVGDGSSGNPYQLLVS